MAAFFADILEKAYTDDGDYQEDPYQYVENDGSKAIWFGPELAVPNHIFHEDPEAVKRRSKTRSRSGQRIAGRGSGTARWIALQDRLSKGNVPTYFPLQYTSEHQDTTTAESIDLSHYPYSLAHTAALEFEARIDGGGGRGSLGIELTYEVDGEEKKKAYHLGDNYETELNSNESLCRSTYTPSLQGRLAPHQHHHSSDGPASQRQACIHSPPQGNRGGFRAFHFAQCEMVPRINCSKRTIRKRSSMLSKERIRQRTCMF